MRRDCRRMRRAVHAMTGGALRITQSTVRAAERVRPQQLFRHLAPIAMNLVTRQARRRLQSMFPQCGRAVRGDDDLRHVGVAADAQFDAAGSSARAQHSAGVMRPAVRIVASRAADLRRSFALAHERQSAHRRVRVSASRVEQCIRAIRRDIGVTRQARPIHA